MNTQRLGNITKAGSGMARWLLAQVAIKVLRKDARLREWYKRIKRRRGSTIARVAVMRTPQGRVEVGLETLASPDQGTIDWRITFPDGSVARAYSRVVELDPGRCAYTFVLMAPPVPLQDLEGALEVQSKTLARELVTLKGILEARGA